MDAETIIRQAHDLGITLRPAGDRIEYAPKELAADDFVESLRRYKTAILEHLREDLVSGARGWDDPKHSRIDAEALEIAHRVQEFGCVLVWSPLLEDLIAFYRTREDLPKVPPGFVPYSEAELRHLFGWVVDAPSLDQLKLVHQAKKLGARVIGSEPLPGDSPD